MRPPRGTLAVFAGFLCSCNAAAPDLRVAGRAAALGRQRPALRGRSSALVGLNNTKGSDGEALVREFSEELARLRKELEDEQQDCSIAKKAQERLRSQLSEALRSASSSTAGLEAKISNYFGQLVPAEGELMNARENIKVGEKQCLDEEKGLRDAQRKAVLAAQQTDDLFKKVVASCQGSPVLLACRPKPGGAVLFQSAKSAVRRLTASQRRAIAKVLGSDLDALSRRQVCQVLLEVSARPRGWVLPTKDLPRTALAPDPIPGGPRKITTIDGPSCGVALQDLVDGMNAQALASVRQAEAQLVEHRRDCTAAVVPFRNEARQRIGQLRTAQVIIAQATSYKSAFRLQLSEITKQLHEVTVRIEQLDSSCTDAIDELTNQIFRVTETRAFVAEQVFGEDAPTFEDCEVGAWNEHPCSKTCKDEDGEGGQQLLTRKIIMKPDKSELGGRLSMDCPKTERIAGCNNEPCPKDCDMSPWSGWAACSRMCGGGEQYRTRGASQLGLYGGMACAATTETQSCNIQSCAQDCTLGEWSAWEPCSRRCMWNSSTPGHAARRQPVLVSAIGGGGCPSEEQRAEWRECNPFECNAHKETLQCSADQDIVFVLDGSGSLGSVENFGRQTELVKGFVERSALSEELAGAVGVVVQQVRVAAAVLGGAKGVTVLSGLTGNRGALASALGAAAWPAGTSTLAEGLLGAKQLFRSSHNRHGTLVLVTDGGVREPAAAVDLAKTLKAEGARIVVILVQKAFASEMAMADRIFCGIASMPCVDNVLRVADWNELGPQLDRFVSVVCSVAFSKVSGDPAEQAI